MLNLFKVLGIVIILGILLILSPLTNQAAKLFYVQPDLRPADVITVFSAGVNDDCTLDLDTTERERYGLSLLQKNLSRSGKIIFTGGITRSSTADIAICMGRYAEKLGFKKDQLIIEPKARTTYENAIYTNEIMQQHHWRSVLLVTSATHIRRSVKTMRTHPVEVHPAPAPLTGYDGLLNIHRFKLIYFELYEICGLIKYQLYHLDT